MSWMPKGGGRWNEREKRGPIPLKIEETAPTHRKKDAGEYRYPDPDGERVLSPGAKLRAGSEADTKSRAKYFIGRDVTGHYTLPNGDRIPTVRKDVLDRALRDKRKG